MTQFTSLLQSLVTIGISLALTVEFFASRAAGDDRLAAFLNSWSFPALFLLLFALSTAYGIRTASLQQKRQYQITRNSEPYVNQREELMKACCSEYQRGKTCAFSTRKTR